MNRTRLLAAAAALACATPAFADIKNVDIYGVVAFGLMSTEGSDGKRTDEVLNESRIGFRGSKELAKLNGAKFIWQIESGFLGPNGLRAEPYESGTLGTRDTWAGLEGGFGKVRIGRLLTPYGETLDWPFANGGVNPLVEATSVPGGGSYVRVSDQIRWDSPKFGDFTVSASFGRGDRDVAADNAFLAENSRSASIVGHYSIGGATLHAGYENNRHRSAASNNSNWLLAAQSPSFGGFSLYGAWLRGSADLKEAIGKYPVGDYDRDTWQLALQYANADWVIKASHARNDDLDGPVTDNGGHISAVQALYILDPSLVVYARYVRASNPATTAGWWNKSRVLLGLEYAF
ncbi:porin [Aquabacterium sp. A7-Y]|uniref:porin n=1 Tax=Aquabacterium sp. A7-Y TaxID=1349605 RepID=UPI00223D7D1A|nr:porin [Aquabacterium sp. A7-Y]MCW7542036.1 porin [Aquabacterium sp. A7-Y]